MAAARLGAGLCVVALGFGAASAQAQSQSVKGTFGSAAFQSVRNCWGLPDEVNCMGPQSPDTSRKETYQPGGPGQSLNSVVYPQSGGTLVSRLTFAELDLPILKSGAWAGDDNRIASTIVSYMGFDFNGPNGTPYALDALIDWKSSGAPRAFQDIQNGIQPNGEYGGEGYGSFSMWLFDAAYVPMFTNANSITSFTPEKTCGSAGVLGTAFLDMVTATSGYHEGSVTLGMGCDGNPITLRNGGSYVLFTQIQTVANRGGFLDATNTIRVQLAEDLPEEAKAVLRESVVTGRSLVPEPATWAMLITGFGAVGMAARRRRALAA
jgi:hypothetical protein